MWWLAICNVAGTCKYVQSTAVVIDLRSRKESCLIDLQRIITKKIMPPVKVNNKWSKPLTAIYEDNYGYGINFYQPMIDYIDAKRQGVFVKPPHLPWNNERGLEKYRFDKPVETYSEQDLRKISQEVAENAKKDLNSLSVTKRSPFSVIATAAATNITRHVETENVTVNAKKKKVQRENINMEKKNRSLKEADRLLAKFEIKNSIESDLKSKAKLYRGKSANSIAKTILDESMQNTRSEIKKALHKEHVIVDDEWQSKALVLKQPKALDIAERLNDNFKIKSMKTYPQVYVVQAETEIPIINIDYIEKLNELKDTIKQFDKLDMNLLAHSR